MGRKFLIVINDDNLDRTKDSGICKESKYWEQDARSKYMQVYGNHFNEHSAKWAVSMLANMDGSDHYWSVEQVVAALKPLGVTLDNYNKWDAYYLANMLYSDYFDAAPITEAVILKMAAYKLKDVDAKDGDIYTMWEAKMMNHCQSIDYSNWM